MKVICVDNELLSLSITVGNTYVVKEAVWNYGNYYLNTDRKVWSYIDKKHFKTLEEIRDEKLKKILD